MSIGQFMPMIVAGESFDPPGSVQFNTVGAWSFTVPNYKNFIRIKLWGGGGGAGPNGGGGNGGSGGNTTCTTKSMTARGGGGGTNIGIPPISGGAGGGATGCNKTNTTGEAGFTGGIFFVNTASYGGASPNGGGRNGGLPGGGGAGETRFNNGDSSWSVGCGGGGGAYCFSEYLFGGLVPGSLLIGAVGGAGSTHFGASARGRALLEWG